MTGSDSVPSLFHDAGFRGRAQTLAHEPLEAGYHIKDSPYRLVIHFSYFYFGVGIFYKFVNLILEHISDTDIMVPFPFDLESAFGSQILGDDFDTFFLEV